MAILSVRLFIHPSVRPSVCLSHGVNQSKTVYQIFTIGCRENSSFKNCKAFP